MKKMEGFTLIELVATLVLVGLLAAVAGVGIVTGVQGYLLSRENAEITQKAQLVMSRLGREILECHNCDANNSYPDPFTSFSFENTLGTRVLALNGNELSLNGNLLLDNVNEFSMSEPDSDNLIEVSFTIEHRHGGGGQMFETRVFPRHPSD